MVVCLLSMVVVFDSDGLDICNTANVKLLIATVFAGRVPLVIVKVKLGVEVRHFLSTGGCFLMLSDLISTGPYIFVAVISWNLISSEDL